MANIEWDANEPSDRGYEAEQVPEHYAGGPTRKIVLDRPGNPFHALAPEFTSERMLLNGFWNSIKGGEVFEPSSSERRDPEDHAGQRGINQRARCKWIQCLIHVLCTLRLEIRAGKHHAPQHGKGDASQTDGDQISGGRCQLTPCDAADEFNELLETRSTVGRAHDSRKGGCSDRWLFCGQRQMESLQQDEAHGVIRSSCDAFDESRQLRLYDPHLDCSREHSQQPTTE